MNDKIDEIKFILNNIKNDLEVIKNIMDIKSEISIDQSSDNYFNNLYKNVNALKKYNNISLDKKDQKSKVSIFILIMHLEKLLYDEKQRLSITKDDMNLLELCISDIDNFSNSLNYYYEDDTKEKFFANIKEIYKSLNKLSNTNFLKDNSETKNILEKYIKTLKNYQEVYKKIPTASQLNLSKNQYKKLDADIYLSISSLEALLYEIFSEIIKSNDKLPYGGNGLLPDNFKEYYISLLKSDRYEELLNIQMLDKAIGDNLTRQRLSNNYLAMVSLIKKISNYYKNDQITIESSDSLNPGVQNKGYDLDLFDDSNYIISADDKKSIDYIIKYNNLNKKMRNSTISRKELKILQLLIQKMEIIKNSVKEIVKNLNISGKVKKDSIVIKNNKYNGKNIQKNSKKNKAI